MRGEAGYKGGRGEEKEGRGERMERGRGKRQDIGR